LRAVGATVDIIESQDKRLIFAVNAATPRARITAEAAVALSQHGTVAPVTVHQRTDFATSMIDGRTVMELDPNSKSAAEIIELWQYIASRLGRIERRRAPQPYSGDERREPQRAPIFGKRAPTPVFGRRVSN
jgi:chromosome partitioning protein